jgi:hypothetical protein
VSERGRQPLPSLLRGTRCCSDPRYRAWNGRHWRAPSEAGAR